MEEKSGSPKPDDNMDINQELNPDMCKEMNNLRNLVI